jgi:glucan phosphoethanolaminetransferase (alkaline phosphatase superfamily)
MKALKIIQTVLLSFFGLLTVFMASSVIFDLFGIREKEGNYVLFIVYTNLICGILYLLAAYTTWTKPKLSFKSLLISLSLLIIAFVAFLLYIQNGGIHEEKTVKAMLFRIVFTAIMTGIGWLNLKNKNLIKEK